MVLLQLFSVFVPFHCVGIWSSIYKVENVNGFIQKRNSVKRPHTVYSIFCKLLLCYLIVWSAFLFFCFLPAPLVLTEPFYHCYLRHFPLERAWLSDVTLPPVSVGQEGEGRGGGQEKQQSWWTGGDSYTLPAEAVFSDSLFCNCPIGTLSSLKCRFNCETMCWETHTHTCSAVFVNL